MGQPAARITDAGLHKKGAGVVLKGFAKVLIGGQPAARQGDLIQHNSSSEPIVEGEPSVLIGGQPAARVGDKIGCGGAIQSGCTTVHIGLSAQGRCLQSASDDGSAFVQAVE
ncbi:putative Zn-binding protein involved in type VI secretion [Tahibacter aquaticus]|uniref:Putative Zn-binding protein involved in type VI secretion n=1 Tax=Tahibacter aquaticus TaxID=520092 RepID=A0A4R6Z6U7_9GAMM|nr:PAAR domain-containing protein [Tahibacter aquaticus]TDR47462.1 putative Zn-binding protein involved in type VI secretion [Tahibacter aquaticus]